MERKILVVANWKANLPEISNFQFLISNSVEVAIAPQFPQIPQIPQGFTKAAQDVSQFPSGAYTGEVSAESLKSLGVKYCLVGHSERRKSLGENNEIVQKKVDQLKKNNILPIVCARSSEDIVPADLVMYEPFEAISTQGEYHPEEPEKIQTVLEDWQAQLPANVKFLYGGSVNPENCSLFIAHCPLLSGFVVGHASLDPQTFSDIISSLCAGHS